MPIEDAINLILCFCKSTVCCFSSNIDPDPECMFWTINSFSKTRNYPFYPTVTRTAVISQNNGEHLILFCPSDASSIATSRVSRLLV